jgi:hypothetical protein
MNPASSNNPARTARRRPRVRRIPLNWALSRTIVASLVAAVLLIGGLSLQMSLGRDPGLGPKLTTLRSSSDGSTGTQTAATTPMPSAAPTAAVPPPAPVQTNTS